MKALGETLIVKVTDIKLGSFVDPNQKPDRGEVISIGKGYTAGEFELGDTVIFNQYGGKSMEENGVGYVLLRVEELYCKL